MRKKLNSTHAFRLFRLFCPTHLLEEIEGDLMQRYESDLRSGLAQASYTSKMSDARQHAVRRANRRLLWNAIRYFRPGIVLRNKMSNKMYFNVMLVNYLKVGFRNLLKNRYFSLINITGLTLGIACAALITLWVQHEFSIDQSYPDSEYLFKAWNRATIGGELQVWSTTPRILAPTLKEEFPEVEYTASFADWPNEFLFSNSDKKFTSSSGPITETSFLKIFNFPFVAGNPETALDDPFSMVITEEFSKRLFGDNHPLGESVHVKFEGNDLDFKITGVIKNLPSTSSLEFDYLISWELFKSFGEEDNYWGNNSVDTYVKLKQGNSIEQFNPKIADIEVRHSNGEHTNEIFLYPINRQHLYSNFTNGSPDGGRIEIVWLISVIAGFILLISCINFINLNTARSHYRAKEVGIRKTIGARRPNLITQFLSESMIMAVLACMMALVVMHLSLPYFNELTGKHLSIDYQNSQYWIGILGFIAISGLLAGGYPAFMLSSFQPMNTLRGSTASSGGTLRQVLVVFQFGFAMVLIVATLVVRDQIDFAQHRNAGYNQEKLIYFPLNGDLSAKFQTFKEELLMAGAAIFVTKTFSPLTQIWSSTDRLEWPGKDPAARINFDRYSADTGLVETAGLELLAGRDLNLDLFPSDSVAALVNETAAKVMNLENPINQVIKDGDREFKIVGVFNDVIVRSPFQKVRPLVVMGGHSFYTIHVRLNHDLSNSEALHRAEEVFKKYSPDHPFEFHFIDTDYQGKFDNEKNTRKFASLFALVSIFISCMGLLGLSLFMIQKRTKEIGIRKVFGASVLNVVSLLTLEPFRLMVIAFAIAAPLSYILMQFWLERFEYRTEVSWQVFVFTGLGSLLLAGLTIGLQTIKSAIRNPVESLRYE